MSANFFLTFILWGIKLSNSRMKLSSDEYEIKTNQIRERNVIFYGREARKLVDQQR